MSKKDEDKCYGKKEKRQRKKDNGAAVESATYLMENPIKDLANKNKISAHPHYPNHRREGTAQLQWGSSFLFFKYFPLFSLKF
jgi:hypothetical protein